MCMGPRSSRSSALASTTAVRAAGTGLSASPPARRRRLVVAAAGRPAAFQVLLAGPGPEAR
jgi:hypothetical protein